MSLDPNYQCDCEFVKLLTRRPDVDLTIVALELARDAYPDLAFQPTLDWIDARAAELAGPAARARTELDVLRELGRCLAGDHGVRGDEAAYERADSSYLHRIIETGRGIPISLSLLYMAVAEKLGIELKGVSTPMHFLTRYESVDGPLFLDAFGRGRVMSAQECLHWISNLVQLPPAHARSTLRAVRPRTIVIRMLNNLKALYVRQECWHRAWVVQHRLTALEPSSYRERRDLAVISLRADRPGSAIDLFRSCLRTCPQDERDVLEGQLAEAEHQLSRWN